MLKENKVTMQMQSINYQVCFTHTNVKIYQSTGDLS